MIAISRRNTFPLAITVLAFAFLGLFLLYPLLNVFGASFLDRTGTSFTLGNYARMLSSSFYLGALTNSLVLGVLSTLVTIVLGVPLAFCLARLPIRASRCCSRSPPCPWSCLPSSPLIRWSCCSAAPASSPGSCARSAFPSPRSTA